MSPILYPTEMPLEHIQEIVNIIRDGKVMVDRSQLGKHLWIVQGYAQHLILDDPDVTNIVRAQSLEVVPQSLSEIADALQAIVDRNDPSVIHAQSFPTPPSWLIKLILELVKIIIGAVLV